MHTCLSKTCIERGGNLQQNIFATSKDTARYSPPARTCIGKSWKYFAQIPHYLCSIHLLANEEKDYNTSSICKNFEHWSFNTSTIVSWLAHCLFSTVLRILNENVFFTEYLWDPPGDRSGFDRSAQTDLQPFTWDDAVRGFFGYTCASSIEPIYQLLIPLRILQQYTEILFRQRRILVLGQPCTGKTHLAEALGQYVSLISAPRVNRSAYKLFPVGQMSFHSIMLSLSMTLKLKGVQVHFNRTQRQPSNHVLF